MDAQSLDTEDAQVALSHQRLVGARIAAALIDLALLIVVFLVMAVSQGDIHKTTTNGVTTYNLAFTSTFLIFLGIVFGYFFLFEALFAGSLGKIVMDLKVVQSDGSRASWRSLLLRNLLRFIDWLPVFYVVGIIAIAVSRQKQRLGDIVSDTFVVRS